ncbi:polycystic kidney disease protein 1-like 2 [Lingula anatina]|uniref:Polycystic kidney disease protein 1-like 2 n=1 Tax=Lingula anatina TaxID=7574 RepID=A0A1S3HYZ3_LINAN|nr:polycystic kidney disease protein 1-like 2 [Lingula anatina]|eukprot:XP_013390791.1 polycystic kidney disease protein 1-like 2 [Lingula anatina]
MMEAVGNLTIDSLSTAQQAAETLTKLTEHTKEITADSQTSGMDTVERLSLVLSSGQRNATFTEVEDTATMILQSTSNLLNASMEESRELNITNMTQPERVKVQKTRYIANKALNVISTISDTVLAKKVPGEEPIVIATKTLSVKCQKLDLDTMSSSRQLQVPQLISAEGGSDETPPCMVGSFALPPVQNVLRDGHKNISTAVDLQMFYMPENPFTWDVSAQDVTSSCSGIKVIIDGARYQPAWLPEPMDIYIPVGKADMNCGITLLQLEGRTNGTMEDVIYFKFDAETNKSHQITIWPVDNNTTLQVYLKANARPSKEEILNSTTLIPIPEEMRYHHGNQSASGYVLFVPENETTEADTVYYIGITLSNTSDLGNRHLDVNENVQLLVTVHSSACLFWDEQKEIWSSEGCKVSPLSTAVTLHCMCHHMTVFSGGFFILPNAIDIVADSALFLTLLENPLVVSIVLCVWGIYLAVVIWARKKDREDLLKAGVTVLEDNDPENKYGYLVTVITGWRTGAGTTANVGCFIKGENGESDRHVLSDPRRPVFESGGVDSFLLTSAQCLGDLLSVTIWHDNSGAAPAWFLEKLMVRDLQRNEVFEFLCNRWLALDLDDFCIQRTLRPASVEEMKEFSYLFSSNSGFSMREKHLWVSVFSCPPNCPFTRTQRLTCALTLLLTTMLTNIMFYGIPTDDPEDQYQVADFQFSLSDIIIGIESGMLMFPVNLVIVQLFRMCAPRPVSTHKEDVMPRTSMEQRDSAQMSVLGADVNHSRSRNNSRVLESEIGDGDVDKLPNATSNSANKNSLNTDDQAVTERNIALFIENESENNSWPCSLGVAILAAGEVTGQVSTDQSLDMDGCFTGCKKESKTVEKDNTWCGSGAGVRPSDLNLTLDLDLLYGESPDIPLIHMDNSNEVSVITLEEEKNTPFRLPWWCIYIAWVVAVLTCLVCSYYTMLYGLKYGHKKSVQWVVAFFTGFFQSVCITQPIKVILIALLVSLILKKSVAVNEGKKDIPQTEDEKYLKDENIANYRKNLQQKRAQHMYKPLPEPVVEHMRGIRMKERRMYQILVELALYVTFTLALVFVTYGHRDPMAFYVTKSTEDVFITVEYADGPAFEEVSDVDSMWEYLEETFVPSLFTSTWYNGDSVTESDSLTADMVSLHVGAARLRQLRVKDVCDVPPTFQSMIHSCTVRYEWGTDDSRDYNTSWTPLVNTTDHPTDQWTYQSAFKLRSLPFAGKHGTYNGGGYVKLLGDTRNKSLSILADLQEFKWIDQRTRAVFLEFTLYNPQVNLFSVAQLLFEFHPTGAIFPFYQIFTCKFYQYGNGLEIFVAVCEVMFILFILTSTYREFSKFRNTGSKEYFSDPWSYIEVAIVCLGYSAIGLFFQRLVIVNFTIANFHEHGREEFVNFFPAAFWDYILGYTLAAMLVLTVLKFFKLLRFNVRMNMLSATLKKSWKPTLHFYLVLAFLMMAYAFFGQCAFGHYIEKFKSLIDTLQTLFTLIMGGFEFAILGDSNRVIGIVFLITFAMIIQVTLINMFIAIIDESFRYVLKATKETSNELEMVDFMWTRLLVILGLHTGAGVTIPSSIDLKTLQQETQGEVGSNTNN